MTSKRIYSFMAESLTYFVSLGRTYFYDINIIITVIFDVYASVVR